MTPFITKYLLFGLPPRCVILNHRNFINRVLPWKYRWAHCYVRMMFSFWFCRNNCVSNEQERKLRTIQKRKFLFNAQCIHLFVLSIALTQSCIFNFGTNNISSILSSYGVILNHRNFINRVLPWKYRWAHCYVRMMFSFWFCRNNCVSNEQERKLRTIQKRKFLFNAQCIHLFVLSIALTQSCILNFGTNNISSILSS